MMLIITIKIPKRRAAYYGYNATNTSHS